MTICNLAIIFIVRNCSVLLPKRVWRRKLCRLPRQKNVPRKLMQVTERQYRKESQCIEWCCLCVWIRLLRRDRESHQAHQTLALRENSTGQELRTKSRRWGCITKQRKKDDVRAGSDIWAGGIWILRIRRDFDDLMLRLARVVALRFARIVASWEIIAVNPWVRGCPGLLEKKTAALWNPRGLRSSYLPTVCAWNPDFRAWAHSTHTLSDDSCTTSRSSHVRLQTADQKLFRNMRETKMYGVKSTRKA